MFDNIFLTPSGKTVCEYVVTGHLQCDLTGVLVSPGNGRAADQPGAAPRASKQQRC
jgi:hypothetical protein